MSEYVGTKEEKELLLEGAAMARASKLAGNDAEFFARGFLYGHICGQKDTTNLSFKKTIVVWEELKQEMKDKGVYE
jgi:hypothetical protein